MQQPIRSSLAGDTAAGAPHTATGAPQHAAAPRPRRGRRVVRMLLVPLLVAAVATAAAPGWGLYRIKPGDTLESIAQRYHTTVARLVAANHLPGNGNLIFAGATLQVPVPAAAQPSAAGSGGRVSYRSVLFRHKVVPGDSVIKIARAYGVPTSTVIADNHLRNSRIIRLGDTLRIWKTFRVVSGAPATSSANTFAGRTYPAAVVASANRHRAYLAARPTPSKAWMRALIVRTARQNRLDPALALAVAYQESGFNAHVVSVADAIGVMQVIPSTGAWASGVVGRPLNLLEPRDNVLAGVVLLKVLTKNASTVQNAIAGYYQGLASVSQRGMFADTKRYVASVMALRKQFS